MRGDCSARLQKADIARCIVMSGACMCERATPSRGRFLAGKASTSFDSGVFTLQWQAEWHCSAWTGSVTGDTSYSAMRRRHVWNPIRIAQVHEGVLLISPVTMNCPTCAHLDSALSFVDYVSVLQGLVFPRSVLVLHSTLSPFLSHIPSPPDSSQSKTTVVFTCCTSLSGG